MTNWNRRDFLATAAVGAANGFGFSKLLAQDAPPTLPALPGETTVAAERSPEDRESVWTLTFRFKTPRIITADVPGKGKKIVWYLWYQVFNFTGEPRLFVPEFELVTLDRKTSHFDEIIPTVQKKISEIEDPANRYDIKNSVTIAKEPIPVPKPLAFPKPVTGVAIWTSVYDRAPDTNLFSIFIAGLSDGWLKTDNVVRRKTLQLNFQRLGDARQLETSVIKFKDSRYIYRSAGTEADLGVEAKPEPKKDE